MGPATLPPPRRGGSRSVAGLVLAAGAGRRLGGRPKALLSYRGSLLVDHALRTLEDAGCEPRVVVLGAAADQVPALPGAIRVVNAEWDTGMGSSLRAGLAALPAAAEAVVVLLVDQPGITAAAVGRIVDAFDAGATVAMADYGGERSHPVLFARQHFAAVAAGATGDAGARRFLRANPGLVVAVPCGDVAHAADLDEPEDLLTEWFTGEL